MKVRKYLLVGLGIAVLIGLLAWQNLSVLNLFSTLLTVVAALLGIVTETRLKNGPSRITKWGKVLVVITLVVGITSVVTSIVKDKAEKDSSRTTSENLEAIKTQAQAAKRQAEAANSEATESNAKLQVQLEISRTLSQTLGFVRRELERERTPVHKVLVEWHVEIPASSECLQDYGRRSSVLRMARVPEEAKPSLRATYTETNPDNLSLSQECRKEVSALLGSVRLNVVFQKKGASGRVPMEDVPLMQRVGKIRDDWTFSAFGSPLGPYGYIGWDEKRNLLVLAVQVSLTEEQLRRQDGARISLAELSEGTVGFNPQVDAWFLDRDKTFSLRRVFFQMEKHSFWFGRREDPQFPAIRPFLKTDGRSPHEWYIAGFPVVQR